MSVAPIKDQPKGNPSPQVCWMSKADSVEDDLGLEYLQTLSSLTIRQQLTLKESFSHEEVENTYQICNGSGEQVYYAQEESPDSHRQCCGSYRKFTMHIRDKLGMEIIRVKKKFLCCGGSSVCACCDGCSNYIEIQAPVAIKIGYLIQEFSMCGPKYRVCDEKDRPLLYIQGPCLTCQCLCCPRDVDFQVLAKDTKECIGKISKTWSGLDQELFSNADTFVVTFPEDLDIRAKAILLGTVFLIDFMFFEESHDHNRARRIV